jgi:sigma-B regulation protein RsbU (phosphoserine phosphatase)
LKYASAGHLPPLLVEGGEARFLQSERGTPLGLVAGEFSETTVELREGSRLLFYSDGITEATGIAEAEYGAQRLQEHFLQSDASPESVLEDVRSFANGIGLRDDATVILVRA